MSTIADDRVKMRAFCVDALGLEADRNVAEIASLVDMWESASARVAVRNKAEAEAGVSSLPRALNKVEVQDVLVLFQKVHGIKLEDGNTPAATTLEQVFDQVEQGEMKNMSLVQFLSREDAEADILGATIEKGTGTLKVKKGYGECQKPRTCEEFRKRMAVLAHTYLLAQLKYPQRAALKDLVPQDFLKYLDLLLGDHVLGLKARPKDGEVVAAPDFELVLSYDFQIRRQTVKLMNEGQTMKQALKEAMTDTTIKERYFLTQVSSSSSRGLYNAPEFDRSRSPPGQSGPWGGDRFGEHGKGKGKSKKGGKGRGKKGKQMHDRTPDGRQICWRWNDPRERCRFQCGRLHVCQLCFGNHPAHSCDGSGKKGTAGGGGDGSNKNA